MHAGLPIEEYPQSPANLTAMSQNLFELGQGQNLICYPDPKMRLAVSLRHCRGDGAWLAYQQRERKSQGRCGGRSRDGLSRRRPGQDEEIYASNWKAMLSDDITPKASAETSQAWRRSRLQAYMRSIGAPFNY